MRGDRTPSLFKWVTAVHLINFFMSEGINSGIQKKNSEGIRSRFV